jgi:hypothetical protein
MNVQRGGGVSQRRKWLTTEKPGQPMKVKSSTVAPGHSGGDDGAAG